MQLERIIHSQGFGTRRESRALVRAGRVRIGGEAVEDPFAEFEPAGLAFEVDGERWHYYRQAYLMLHKPAGYECSHAPRSHPSVYGLLPAPLIRRGVQSVGRLDQDTTGLLLFSDDGQFIHRWSSGKKAVHKHYRARLKHPVSDALPRALCQGVVLHDETVPIAALSCVAIDALQIELVVTEGKYHQVKRMIAAAGNRVEQLHRFRIGGLELPASLAPGEWSWIAADALEGHALG